MAAAGGEPLRSARPPSHLELPAFFFFFLQPSHSAEREARSSDKEESLGFGNLGRREKEQGEEAERRTGGKAANGYTRGWNVYVRRRVPVCEGFFFLSLSPFFALGWGG